jgi:Protein of unknown function (DUF3592)
MARGSDGAFVFAAAGGIFTVVGGILLAVFGWGVPADHRIDRAQVSVDGTVTGVTVDPTRRRNRMPMTRLDFSYRVEGRAYANEHWTIDPNFIETHPVGAVTRVELNPEEPEESRLSGTRVALFGPLGLVAGIVPAIGLGLLAAAGVTFLRGRRVRTRSR